MNKKSYLKPELKTRKIALGVFGDYGNDQKRAGGGNGSPNNAAKRFDLFMD